jgi:AraC family transcriptional regulator
MGSVVLYIKNMVCVRCKMAVQTVLEELKIGYLQIDLGRVRLTEELTPEQQKDLNTALNRYELELLDNRKSILVEQIKILILEMFNSPDSDLELKFSEYLSKTLHHEYTYMANVFSEKEGSTIEKFYILTRIDKVKALLVYEALSIKEIAYRLNYSSESHLCQQFKKITGQTPSAFKKMWEAEKLVWRT